LEAQFEALAVIEHSGSMTSDGDRQGHYICDVKSSQSKTWFKTNDNMDPVPINLDSVTKKAVVVLYKKK
jgi:ubiquitin C-terminal hydrolase